MSQSRPPGRGKQAFAGRAVRTAVSLCLLAGLADGTPLLAGEEKPAPKERLNPAGIDGTLLLHGGGKLSDAVVQRFVELAGGEKAHLVVIPGGGADEKQLEPWKERKPASVVLLHTSSRKTADDPAFVEPLRKATGVWLDGGDAARLVETYRGTAVEKELHAVLGRGGVVGGTAAGAAVLSRLVLFSEKDAKTGQGLDLLPGTVLDPGPRRDGRPRLFGVLDKDPGLLGLALDEGTALQVRGRQLRVVGDGAVTVCLAGSKAREPRTVELKPGTVADLTQWRRAALARGEPPFPPREAPVPEVAGGALVIVGGGGMPDEVTKKFIELAGGPDALIVVLPTANPDPIPANAGAALFQRAGAKNVQVIPARELKDVEDPKNLDVLKKAKGVWFGGGRQWRFVDAYENTKAHELFRDVLRRGGVIGGSSAGATIQGDYLCRGSPLNNTDMICEGYERGLGFLPGVAIDQHFTQRKRFADMTALVKTYPQLLGVGIDEATALVAHGHVAEIMGRGQAHFYDRNKPAEEGKPDYEAVQAGGRYDLKARKALPPAEKKGG